MYVRYDEAIEKIKLAMNRSVVDGSLVKVEYDVCHSILGYIDELKSEIKILKDQAEGE